MCDRDKAEAGSTMKRRRRFTKKLSLLLLVLSLMTFHLSTRLLATHEDTYSVGDIIPDFYTSQRASGQPIARPWSAKRTRKRLVHVAVYGLGHRLLRAASAWHIAHRWNMTEVKFQWGSCGPDGRNIFEYLFESDTWSTFVENESVEENISGMEPQEKRIIVRNDVYGYVPGQSLKNMQVPINRTFYNDFLLDKIRSDSVFYEQIASSFRFRKEVDEFVRVHSFDTKHVIGLHLRAGNGEQTHFKEAKRSISNETEFVHGLVDLIGSLVQRGSDGTTSHRPTLLFLATDTVSLVPVVKQLLRGTYPLIELVVLDQIRVPDNHGVTFEALKGAGEKCLDAWKAMVMDMLILSRCNVVVAARHSSYTQSLPLHSILRLDGDHDKSDSSSSAFCEVDDNGREMICFSSLDAFLFRPHTSSATTFHLDGAPSTIVPHKLLIHFPDVEFPPEYHGAMEFLRRPSQEDSQAVDGEPLIHSYGSKRYNPQYRRTRVSTRHNWNISFEIVPA